MVGWKIEGMIGLVKQSLFKATGRANLTKQELKEILLDIVIVLNNRPLIYIEDDRQMPFSTPNTLLYGQPIIIPQERLDEDTPEIKRRQLYINKFKEVAWETWKKKYLRSLREKHNMMHNTKEMKIGKTKKQRKVEHQEHSVFVSTAI